MRNRAARTCALASERCDLPQAAAGRPWREGEIGMQERRLEGIVHSVDARGIARIVLDRPAAHNTISQPVSVALAQAIDAVIAAAPRVVLLTGTGTVFCAGGDIDEFKANAGALDALVDRILTVLHPAIARLAASPVPVVTAVNGAVGGAGVGLALCGDFALAAASMKLRTGYAAIGLSPDAGASWFLARRVGALRARQLFFTSETLDAPRCLAAGIVDAVVDNDRLRPEAEALCARLAAAAPGSLAAIRRLCDGAAPRSLVEHLDLEKATLEERARSADACEGVEAFLARRAPVFRGD
jgi:2-(1,2-epoxy-1,2-dihydrophenyl)acetyl-CoA isomerase